MCTQVDRSRVNVCCVLHTISHPSIRDDVQFAITQHTIFDRFDKVLMHFLIVGHTHSVIDQYFSVISRKIFEAEFIATPHALHALIMLTPEGDDKVAKGAAKDASAVMMNDDEACRCVVPEFCKFIEVCDFVFEHPFNY